MLERARPRLSRGVNINGLEVRDRELVAVSDGDNVVFTMMQPYQGLPYGSTLRGTVTLGAYESQPSTWARPCGCA